MDYSHRITPVYISDLHPLQRIVVGSNLAGRHGAGLAKQAVKKWGARYYKAEGLQGQCYMIPVKDGRLKEDPKVKRTLTIDEIKPFVDTFFEVADSDLNYDYLVPLIGCGLAGYKPADMAPLFRDAIVVPNVKLPIEFWKVLTANLKGVS